MNKFDPEPSLQDEAARAGWLYYVGGLTQDQIAAELGVSRQRAQRLVSRAMAEGLIHVRLNHRIGACLDLESELTARFGLSRCRVSPRQPNSFSDHRTIILFLTPGWNFHPGVFVRIGNSSRVRLREHRAHKAVYHHETCRISDLVRGRATLN